MDPPADALASNDAPASTATTEATMDPQADALASNDAEPTAVAVAAAVQPETAIVPVPTFTSFNGASTSVPEPTAAATQLGTVTMPMSNMLEMAREMARSLGPTTNNTFAAGAFAAGAFSSGAVFQAGGTVTSQTMNTGGGAPNGTGGSPNVSGSAMEFFASRLERKMDDLKETVIGQGDRILTAIARKKPRTDYGSPPPMQSPDDAYQTPMTGVPRKSARNQSVRPILQDHCPRGASSYVSGAEVSNGRSTESPSGAFSAGIDGEEANGAVAENTQTGAVPGLTNNATSAVLDSDSTAVEFLDAIQDGAPADGADVLTVA